MASLEPIAHGLDSGSQLLYNISDMFDAVAIRLEAVNFSNDPSHSGDLVVCVAHGIGSTIATGLDRSAGGFLKLYMEMLV